MTKLRVQAQHLRTGDLVGSGERIEQMTSLVDRTKVAVVLSKGDRRRSAVWGRYTTINIQREQSL